MREQFPKVGCYRLVVGGGNRRQKDWALQEAEAACVL